jgi:hypothetical protein
MNDALGPRSDKPTMPLALDFFDMGSLAGFSEASDWSFARVMLCACADSPCTEENQQKAIALTERVTITDAGKREREGVSRLLDSLASHSCLSGEAAAQLFKLGYRCGFTTGLKSPYLAEERYQLFLRFESGDSAKARQRVTACDAIK